MRIACIYLPSFPLQVHVRRAPHLAGQAFAVSGDGERPSIVACSRAAFELGVRVGNTATQARALAPDVHFIKGIAANYRDALTSLGETLLPYSVTVDIGSEAERELITSHRSIYLTVPKGKRGATFAQKLLDHVTRLGFRGRVGIADDRFTAWAAATTGGTDRRTSEEPSANDRSARLFRQASVVVPRGNSAAFLAPLPLELLPLADEVRHMLRTLGVETLGDFAALPPPSVGRRWQQSGVDYQRLARGEGPDVLRAFTPDETVVEHLDLEHEVSELEPLSFLLRPLAERVCKRLVGRGTGAGRVSLMLLGRDRDRECTELTIAPARPTVLGGTLVDLARAQLSELSLDHPVVAVGLVVQQEAEPVIEELDLFDYRDAAVSPDAVDIAVARLRAAFGDDAVSAAELVDTYRPEAAFALVPFSPQQKGRKKNSKRRSRAGRTARKRTTGRQAAACATSTEPLVMNGLSGALRLLSSPERLPDGLRTVRWDGASRAVVASNGPTRVEGEWWTDDPVDRDYYEVETDDGGRYWVYRQKSDGHYYLHGIFD